MYSVYDLESIEEKVSIVLDLLISACLENQKKIKDIASHDISFVNEFATVRMTCARGTGHSTSIIKYCKKHSDQKFLVLSYNEAMSSQLLNISKNEDVDNCLFDSFYRSVDFDMKFSGLYDLDGVFVDCSFMMPVSAESKLKQVLLPALISNKDKQFFFAFVQ